MARWQDYEVQIVERIRDRATGPVSIVPNATLPGRSGADRQIDVLVDGHFAGLVEARLVVDCKCWSTKVDVKDVEAFLGLVDDVDATFGLLVTTVGFSAAARNRTRRIATEVVPLVEVGLFEDASTWWLFNAGQPGRYVGDYYEKDVYSGQSGLFWIIEFQTGQAGQDDWEVETIWATDDGGWDAEDGAGVLATVLSRHRFARNPTADEVEALTRAFDDRLEDGQGFCFDTDEIDSWALEYAED